MFTEQMFWEIGTERTGRMSTDEFRNYYLGFVFYSYLSKRMIKFADSILKADGIKYQGVDEKTVKGKEYLETVKAAARSELGYFLKPSELFDTIAKRCDVSKRKGERLFFLEELASILKNIEQSTKGTKAESDFENLFEDLDLTSRKFGRTENARNQLISSVLSSLAIVTGNPKDGDWFRKNYKFWPDNYQSLIGRYTSVAEKKVTEFYTPSDTGEILAKIITTGKTKLRSIYDPACGTASLLLRAAREVSEIGMFYGQEFNRQNYNVARMHMILNGVPYEKFDI